MSDNDFLTFLIHDGRMDYAALTRFVFRPRDAERVRLSEACLQRVEQSHGRLNALAESGEPIYGVTTGFGDSSCRRVPLARSEQLQCNLVRYLLCGTGAALPRESVRAMTLARLVSLTRGFSGVSPELVDRLRFLLERDWLPVVPREGSLGASGDLIPLAYLARAVQGEGEVDTPTGKVALDVLLTREGMSAYRLKPKEGLALVNGTSAMAGVGVYVARLSRFLTETAALVSAWVALGLEGRAEAFGELVNREAKSFRGQGRVADWIRVTLEDEDYRAPSRAVSEHVQDRYSLRCAPQILGPILDTLDLVDGWLETEINGVSDNPLVSPDGRTANGGNFYGGYLGHGMDYLKICLGHLADLADRQLTLLVDEKTNRGLPPNLAAWPQLPEEERYLHHGLKGLHQSVSAVTAECLNRTIAHGIFSRSTESHNQDKVSLGMSAAVGALELCETLFRVQAMQVVVAAQAIDLRGRELKGTVSRRFYQTVRQAVAFVSADRALDLEIERLARDLRRLAIEEGAWFQ